MGKNSLIKSTSKKKKSQKKAEEQVVQAVGVETAPAAQGKPKTAALKKESPKTPTAVIPSHRELIFKKFSDRQKPSMPEMNLQRQGRYTAPPLYTTAIQAEIKRFKTLLFRKFDLSGPAETANGMPVQSPAVMETAPVPDNEILKTPAVKPTYRDLIFKTFSDHQQNKPQVAPSRETKQSRYAAPPFYTAAIQAEIKQFKTLLFKKFELSPPVEETIEQETLDETTSPSPAVVQDAPAEKVIHPVKPTPPLKRSTPDQKVTIAYSPGKAAKPSDPRDTLMKLVVAVFAFFVLVIVGASFSNHGTYHLVDKNGKTEIWQGRFGPMGQVLLMTLPGRLIDKDETSGSKKEIFPVIVAWYLHEADKGLDVAPTPDFKEIRSLLSSAEPFAVTPELKKEILSRATVIDLMALLYKAEVAAGVNTAEGFKDALSYLQEAKSLKTDALQTELIDKKISEMEQRLTNPDVILPNAQPEAGKVQ